MKDIPADALETILSGGNTSYGVKYGTVANDYVYDLAVEGITNMVERWYRDSTSEKIRSWAEEFLSIVTCPTCDGYRLKKSPCILNWEKNISVSSVK